VLQVVRIPSLLCSSIAFGGDDLKQLYVITGSETVNTDREYYAGSLFVLEDVGVRGILKRPYHPEHLAQANI